jgi:hypothetical protein
VVERCRPSSSIQIQRGANHVWRCILPSRGWVSHLMSQEQSNQGKREEVDKCPCFWLLGWRVGAWVWLAQISGMEGGGRALSRGHVVRGREPKGGVLLPQAANTAVCVSLSQ